MERPFIVDCDTHFWQPFELWGHLVEPRHRDTVERAASSHVFANETIRRKIEERSRIRGADHLAERLEAMDAIGIDATIIYPTLMGFLAYLDDLDVAAAACRALNEWSAAFAKGAPGRLLPCMMLPFYDPDRALQEYRHAVSLGLRVAFSTPTPSPARRWSDPAYEPLWSAMEADRVVMTFHEFTRLPGSVTTTVSRQSYRDSYPMNYLCGHTVEAQLTLMDMVLGGVLTRHPGLRLGLVECHVAWLAGWLRLMDDQWPRASSAFESSAGTGGLDLLPSQLFRRQGFVVGFPDDTWIDVTAAQIGPEVVVLGTDYPHPQTRPDIFEGFRARYPEMDEETTALIVGGNAVRIFGLDRVAV